MPRKPESAASRWPSIAGFVQVEAAFAARMAARGPLTVALYEFVRFGVKQGWACLFGGIMLALILTTHAIYPAHAPVARYDVLFVAALLVQLVMLWAGLETVEEAKVIAIFHVIGTLMEIHKTSIGAWIYPGASLFHIGGVPLFTGFMYAAVGSYLARVWRLFDFRFARHPSLTSVSIVAVAIYINFLTDDRGLDARWALIAIVGVLFARTRIYFKIWRCHRYMPLLVGFALVALFIWFAENIGTFTGTWLYPRQMAHWSIVPASKLTSWFLLMIVSYALVARLNGVTTSTSIEAQPAPDPTPQAP